MMTQRKMKMIHGKIKIYRYKDNPQNKYTREYCICCNNQFPRTELINIAMNQRVYYNRNIKLKEGYLCEPCYEIFRDKILSFDNMDDIVRTIELQYEVLQLTAKLKHEETRHKILSFNHKELKDEYNVLMDKYEELNTILKDTKI